MITQIQKILREAGELSLTYHRKLTASDVEYKAEIDLVTKVDREVEELLKSRLGETFPDVLFFGEEGSYGELASMEKVFICDPIDGTINFVHGHPIYSISLAYRENGVTKIGAVYLPYLDNLYWAELGKGAFLDGRPIHVSKTAVFKQAVVGVGFACVRDGEEIDSVQLFAKTIYKARAMRRCGSAAADLCFVADGTYDLFWEKSLSPWDVAGGVLIVQEAGGKVSDFLGGDQAETRREILAGNGVLNDEFQQMAKAHFGLEG